MENVSYTIPNSSDITSWQELVECSHLLGPSASCNLVPHSTITPLHSDSVVEDDITVESNISLKDHHMTHTLLKISENLDQDTLRIVKAAKDKGKGFSKLECHKRLLFLNATETDIPDEAAFTPIVFCKAFLLKTTIYHTKKAL